MSRNTLEVHDVVADAESEVIKIPVKVNKELRDVFDSQQNSESYEEWLQEYLQSFINELEEEYDL